MSNEEVVRISVKDLNRLLTCKLCLGYFQDAHTVTECMHTFCHACITSYFERLNDGRVIPCPTCGTEVGFYHIAVTKIIFDRNIQSIVDKIFPPDVNENRLIQQQLQQQVGMHTGDVPMDDILEFTVKTLPDEECDASLRLPAIPKPSFKGKWDVSIRKIQKFVTARFDEALQESIGRAEGVEILFEGKVLDPKSDLSHFQSVLANPSFASTHTVPSGDDGAAKQNSLTLLLHYRRKLH
jgi:hypothetical protein